VHWFRAMCPSSGARVSFQVVVYAQLMQCKNSRYANSPIRTVRIARNSNQIAHALLLKPL